MLAVGRTSSARAWPWGLALVFLVGLLMKLPTLGVGFFADDYVQQVVLTGQRGPLPIPLWNLYDWGTAADWTGFGREHEALPWWTASDWKVRFFRPLTSLSLGLDHALWGSDARGYHVTNLFLWLVLLALAYRLYRALGLASGVATTALFVFVLSDSSSVPVGWIANRNTLLEAALACAAVLAALRGRAAGALVLGLAAALSKESGSFALLLLAWILQRRGQGRAALGALALFGAELAFLVLEGYGTRSLFYSTPWSDPGAFLANLALLASGGVLALLGPLPLDLTLLLPGARIGLLLLGVAAGWPLAVWIVRRAPNGPSRSLALAWTALFLVPQAGALPADRLLFVPSIGAAALLALAWSGERARWHELSRLRRVGAGALALSVTLGSGLLLLAQDVDVLPGMARHLRDKALATELGPPASARLEVLVLQTESQMQAFTLASTWHAVNEDESVRFSLLQSGPRALRWTRTGERTFELETLGRPFLDGPFERVNLVTNQTPSVGTRWKAYPFEVEALAVDASGLRRIRVALDRSLDDPTLRFLRPIEGVLSPIAPPAIGATIEIAEAVSTRRSVP